MYFLKHTTQDLKTSLFTLLIPLREFLRISQGSLEVVAFATFLAMPSSRHYYSLHLANRSFGQQLMMPHFEVLQNPSQRSLMHYEIRIIPSYGCSNFCQLSLARLGYWTKRISHSPLYISTLRTNQALIPLYLKLRNVNSIFFKEEAFDEGTSKRRRNREGIILQREPPLIFDWWAQCFC